MKQDIITHLDNPSYLEKLYRSNKSRFKKEFGLLYSELPHNDVTACWRERLHGDSDDISWGNSRELMLVILAALLAGCIAKIPDFFHLNPERFYPRNIGFVIFPVLTAYFGWKNSEGIGKAIATAVTILAGLIFINWLPGNQKSDTLTLSCIHLLLFLWSVLGFAFAAGENSGKGKRLGYLKYNGELIIITTLIVMAGGIITAIFINLFMLAGFKLNDEYLKNIPIFGLPMAIMMGTYLTQTNPQLVGKISPVIARLFTPLVLVMLVVYLIATTTLSSSMFFMFVFCELL